MIWNAKKQTIMFDVCILLEYISRESQDIPMDWHSATERNAQSLFITELLRGNQNKFDSIYT